MRWWLIPLAVSLGLLLSARAETGSSPRPSNRTLSSRGAKSATLQEQLEKGLRARLPQEFAFVKRVVRMVDKGTLPLRLVRSTFNWARRKRPYPFPYFERGLKKRAARIGILIR